MPTLNGERLSIEIKNTRPVELLDLTRALLAVGDQYKRFVAKHFPDQKRDMRLVVREIRSGSIITELEPLTSIIPIIGGVNDLLQFGNYLRALFGRLLNREATLQEFSKADYTDASRIVNPIAKDAGSQVNIAVNGNNNTVIQILNTDSVGANAIQNRANEEKWYLSQTNDHNHDRAILYIEKANSRTNNTGTYGKVDSLGHGAVKLIFEQDEDRQQMLDNPFRVAYVVDLVVETAFQKPVAYRILRIHDTISIDESDDGSIHLFDK